MKKLFALTTLLAALVFNLNAQTWTPGTGLLYANPTTTKVGIGTNSPQSNTMLDVRGMVGVSRWGLGGTYNSTQVQGIWSISPTYLINTTTNDFGTLYGMGYAHTNAGTGSKKPIANFGHQIVYTSNGTVNASISLDYGHAYFNGNVGIGTSTPSSKFEVQNGDFSLKANANDAGDIIFKKSDLSQLGRIWTQSNGTSGLFLSSGDNVADLYIDPTGKVGIGITTPSEKLEVVGNIYLNSGIDDNHIYWRQHNMTMGTRPGDYAHNKLKIKPGGASQGNLFSVLEMYSANSETSHELKIQIHTAGVSYFNGGNVGIGTTNPTATLTVNGNILAERIDVIGTVPESDFVFEEDYKLRSLEEVEQFVKENKHLPEVPSAAEFKENGYSVGQMDDLLLRKVEELTLYIIEQQKLIEQLQEKVEQLEVK